MDARLSVRYQRLVMSYMKVSEPLSAGLKALSDGVSSFAHTQGAWRFYANPAVSLRVLQEPLLAAAREGIAETCGDYALCIHDWSRLAYRHANKPDRYAITHAYDQGYDLQSSVVVSDQTGQPIAPVAQCLVSALGRHATYDEESLEPCSHLDEVTQAMVHSQAQGFPRPLVHIMDREGDSVGHYRQWQFQGLEWLVRVQDNPRLAHNGVMLASKTLADQLTYHWVRTVQIQGKPHQQYVAEVPVSVTRRAKPSTKKQAKPEVSGEPVTARFVVSRLMNEQGQPVAQWLLLTNTVTPPAATLVLWYYWRWQIESFFKRLKSAGHQLEAWQQESAQAVAKRLLVTSMACVTVWAIAASPQPEVQQLRQFLIRLSGRQMRHTVEFTYPALLAGLETFLALVTLINQYDPNEIQTLAQTLRTVSTSSCVDTYALAGEGAGMGVRR